MAKIVVVVQSDPSTSLLNALRRVSSVPLGRLRTALSRGEPLLERQVFGNDHDEAALEILRVVDCLEELRIPYERVGGMKRIAAR
jgi:hypothetical protein